jgi:hypothetical protein
MRLTDTDIRHFRNVLWGVRFWRWFRWILVLVLGYTVIGHFTGWKPVARVDWLAAGAAYLLVAWPGLCRTYVFHTLHRVVSEDPEARSQLAEAGVPGFGPGSAGDG